MFYRYRWCANLCSGTRINTLIVINGVKRNHSTPTAIPILILLSFFYFQFSCGTCDKTFVRFSNLRQHHLTHSDERCFSCPLCEKTFKRSCGLSAHHRSFHLKLRPFQCETCMRKFALKADMRRCKHIVRQSSQVTSRRRRKQVTLQPVAF